MVPQGGMADGEADQQVRGMLARLEAELAALEAQRGVRSGNAQDAAVEAAILQARDGIQLVEALLRRISDPPAMDQDRG